MIAHRIDRFVRRPGSYQHGFTREVLRDAEPLQCRRDDVLGLGQSTRADHAACQISAAGLDDEHAALPQHFKVGLRRRMLPHVYVHGRSHNHRRLGREVERREKIVGDALGELRDDVSAVAGATSKASIDCATAMCSTAESRFGCSSPRRKCPVMTFSPDSAAKVSGRTNSCAASVMMTCTRDATLLQQAHDLSGFVGGNASGHSQSNFHDF